MRISIIKFCLWLIGKLSVKPTGFLALPGNQRRAVLEEYCKRGLCKGEVVTKKLQRDVISIETGPSLVKTSTWCGCLENSQDKIVNVFITEEVYSPNYRVALQEINEFLDSGEWRIIMDEPITIEERLPRSSQERVPKLSGSKAAEQQKALVNNR